jgi:hypothetical protein
VAFFVDAGAAPLPLVSVAVTIVSSCYVTIPCCASPAGAVASARDASALASSSATLVLEGAPPGETSVSRALDQAAMDNYTPLGPSTSIASDASIGPLSATLVSIFDVGEGAEATSDWTASAEVVVASAIMRDAMCDDVWGSSSGQGRRRVGEVGK